MSNSFSTLFDSFRAAPVFRPLLGGSDFVILLTQGNSWLAFHRETLQVDSNDKVTRLRRECPHELCGPGIFMAMHFNRYYCGALISLQGALKVTELR